jgi:hypothetical protein
MKLLLILILLPMLTAAQFNPEKWQTVDTITYQDPEQDENYFTITAGNTAKHFQIYPCSGVFQIDTNAFNLFTRSKTYYITIKATDASGLFNKRVAKVVLTKPRNAIVTMQ